MFQGLGPLLNLLGGGFFAVRDGLECPAGLNALKR